jgi:FAD/FMN-containing dehydrogenase
LMPFLAERGRAFPGGHCPTVAVSGYLLNGGQGWNSRVWGWACQSVVAIDVVMADGEMLHATESENAELLWAARGAGPGFFGIVVRWYLQTYPRPLRPSQSTVVWSMDHLDDVLRWAHEVLPSCEPECEPAFFSTWSPSLPWTIEPGGDGHVLMLHATAMVDSPEEADRAFAPLSACPLLDRAAHAEFGRPTSLAAEYAELAVQLPEDFHYAADCLWTDAGPDDLLPLLRAAFTDLPTEQSFTLWNGWDPPARPDMAFSLEGRVYLASYAIWDDPALADRCRDFVTSTYRRLEPIGKGAYVGDSDPVRRPDRFMAPENFTRLQAIRERYDPSGLFTTWAVAPGAVANRRRSPSSQQGAAANS